MPKVEYNKAFIKILKKFLQKRPGLAKRFFDRVELLAKNPHAPELKYHKLTGDLKDHLAISIDYDNRLIFDYEEKTDTFFLGDIGPHDDVY